MSLLLALENGEIGLLDLQTQRLQETGITIDNKLFMRTGKERHEISQLNPQQITEHSDAIAEDSEQEIYFTVSNASTAGLLTDEKAYVGTRHGELHRFDINSGMKDVISRLESFTSEERMWDLYGTRKEYEKAMENLASWKRTAKNNNNPEIHDIVTRQIEEDAKRTGRYFDLVEKFYDGFWSIDNIIQVGTLVWDFSYAGIFNSDTQSLMRDSKVQSPQLWRDQLIGAFTNGGIREYLSSRRDSNEIYDESTRDLQTMDGLTILPGAAPFDGSGGHQGYITALDNLVFRHHGNWPSETLDVFDLGKKEQIGKVVGGHMHRSQVLQDGNRLYFVGEYFVRGLHDLTISDGDIHLQSMKELEGRHLRGFNTSDGLLLSEYVYHESTTKLHKVENGKLQGSIELPYKAKVLDVRE